MPETVETFNCILCEKPTPLSKAVSMGEEDACPACAEKSAEECNAVAAEFEASEPTWTLRAEPYFPGTEGLPLEIRFVTTDGQWRLDFYPENDSWAAEKVGKGDTTGYRYDDPTEVGVPDELIAVRDEFYRERDRALDAEAKAEIRAVRLRRLAEKVISCRGGAGDNELLEMAQSVVESLGAAPLSRFAPSDPPQPEGSET